MKWSKGIIFRPELRWGITPLSPLNTRLYIFTFLSITGLLFLVRGWCASVDRLVKGSEEKEREGSEGEVEEKERGERKGKEGIEGRVG